MNTVRSFRDSSRFVLAFAGFLLAASPALAEPPALDQLVKKVAENEALYARIEVKTDYNARTHTENLPNIVKPAPKTFKRQHYVAQGDLYYFRNDTTDFPKGEEPVRSSYSRAFDGEKTRFRHFNGKFEVRDGRFEQEPFLPHTWIAIRNGINVPLSALLTGGQGLKLHPLGAPFKFREVANFVDGEETIDDLPCVKVRNVSWRQMDPVNTLIVYRFWLAPSRNYLPVRMECLEGRFSTVLPGGVHRASDFREVAKGVWLSHRLDNLTYDHDAMTKGRSVLAGTVDYTISEIRLTPDYDVEFFRNVK